MGRSVWAGSEGIADEFVPALSRSEKKYFNMFNSDWSLSVLLVCSASLFLTFVTLVDFFPATMLMMSYTLLDSPWMSAQQGLSFGFLDVLFHQHVRRQQSPAVALLNCARFSWKQLILRVDILAVSLSRRNFSVFWLTRYGRFDDFFFPSVCYISSFIHSQYKVAIAYHLYHVGNLAH